MSWHSLRTVCASGAARVAPALAIVLAVLATCTLRAGAAPDSRTPEAPSNAADVATPDLGIPGFGAMTVERDPITGALSPIGSLKAREMLPLWAAAMRPSLDRPAVTLADGSLMVDLTGIYLDYAVAQAGWDGRPRVACDAPFVPAVLLPIEPPATAGWAER
jgi:hypothetical protein